MRRISKITGIYHEFTEAAYASHKGIKRAVVCLCNVIISIYITSIVILHNLSNVVPTFKVAFICELMLLSIVYQMLKFLIIKYNNWNISRNAERTRLSWKIFVVSTLIVLFVYIIDLLAHYPGGISTDNIVQWEQVLSGKFNNWHPAIHTMVIWLVTRIVPTYSFFIGFQILCFSALSGYMATTLAAWGIKKGYIIAFLITIISTHSTQGILLYAWKDTALTICFLCLAVYMINIVLSDGIWLHKLHNAGAIAIVSALASIIRHNGFFFTVPIGILAIVFYRKSTRNVIFTVVVSCLIVLGITKVIYPLAKVEYHASQTYIESVGIPMTIMGGVIVRNPEALDPQTKEFLNKLADDETWKNTYISGSYNSIKWAFSAPDVVAETPPKEFMLMTLRTISEYSCVVKPQFREIGNRLTGTWEPPYASLLAHVFV